MPILLLLTVFVSGALFPSQELFAESAEQREEVMDSLNQVFQANEEAVQKQDTVAAVFLEDIKDCPYKDNLAHNFQAVFYDTCDEIIDQALEDQLSYFLLKKAVEESSFEEEDRRQAVRDSLQSAKDDKCQNSSSFLSDPPPSIDHDIGRRCIQGEDDCYGISQYNYIGSLCKEEKAEQDQAELIAYLSSELKTCPLEKLDSFSCKALIEEAQKSGLSYYQIRYAIQEVKEKEEEKVEVAVVGAAEKKSKEKRQIAKP